MEDRGGCRDKKEEATDKETEVGTGMSLVFTTPDWMLSENIFYCTKCLSLILFLGLILN